MIKCAGLGAEFAGGRVGGGVDSVEKGAVGVRVSLDAAIRRGLFFAQLVVGRW